MKPLWEAAKNTVDGGMKELEEIITGRRKKNLLESETLKLEVVARDLQILSMVSLEFLSLERIFNFKKYFLTEI